MRLKLRQHRQRVSGKIGQPLDDLPTIPGVQSLSIATRYIDGGRERFIEFVQFAVLQEIEAAKKWYVVYADLLPSERRVVSFDDVCAASGVRPSDLLAGVISAAMEYGIDVGNFVAAVAHPLIVSKSIESAQRITGKGASIGLRDREMLFQHHNFVPTGAKGPLVQVSNHASANAQSAAVAAADPSVPSFAATMHRIRSVTPQLGPANEALEPIDMATVTGEKQPVNGGDPGTGG